MVTLAQAQQQAAQARQQIATSRQQLADEKRKVEEYDEYLKTIQTPRRDISFQQSVIQGNRAIAGRVEQTIAARKKFRREGQAKVDAARSEIQSYEGNLTGAEQQVSDYEAQIRANQKEQVAVRQANKALARLELIRKGVIKDANPLQGLSGRALELFRENQRQIKEPEIPDYTIGIDSKGQGYSIDQDMPKAKDIDLFSVGPSKDKSSAYLEVKPLNNLSQTIKKQDNIFSLAIDSGYDYAKADPIETQKQIDSYNKYLNKKYEVKESTLSKIGRATGITNSRTYIMSGAKESNWNSFLDRQVLRKKYPLAYQSITGERIPKPKPGLIKSSIISSNQKIFSRVGATVGAVDRGIAKGGKWIGDQTIKVGGNKTREWMLFAQSGEEKIVKPIMNRIKTQADVGLFYGSPNRLRNLDQSQAPTNPNVKGKLNPKIPARISDIITLPKRGINTFPSKASNLLSYKKVPFRGDIIAGGTDIATFFGPTGGARAISFTSSLGSKTLLGEKTSFIEKATGGLMVGPGLVRAGEYAYGKTLGKLSEELAGVAPKRVPVASLELPGNVRQRATILIQDTKGKTLFQKDVNTGFNILPGGGIEAGEKPIIAARRELFEETGLNLKLEPFDKVKTEREMNYIFRAQVDDLSKLSLKAQKKEVSAFSFIKPRKGYSGRTASKPFGERNRWFNPFSNPVRAEDLYIASRARTINEFNALGGKKSGLSKEAFLKEKGMQYNTLTVPLSNLNKTKKIKESLIDKGYPKVVLKRFKREKGTLGRYSPNTNTIRLNLREIKSAAKVGKSQKLREQVFFHEFGHSLATKAKRKTDSLIDVPKAYRGKKLNKFIKDVDKEFSKSRFLPYLKKQGYYKDEIPEEMLVEYFAQRKVGDTFEKDGVNYLKNLPKQNPLFTKAIKETLKENKNYRLPRKEILNQLMKGKDYLDKSVKTSDYPDVVVGFGSRYNVPFKNLRRYAGKDLYYVSGSGSPGALAKGERLSVIKGKNIRGEGVLYFQPPTTAGKDGQAYLGLSYTGILTKKQKSYETGITFRRPKPTAYLYKGQAGRELIFTKKAQRGIEFEVGAPPGTVFRVKRKIPSPYLGNKRMRIRELELVQAAPGQLTNVEIGQGLANLNKMSRSQRDAFVGRIRRETGIDYSESLGKRYVNPYKLAGKGSSGLRAGRGSRYSPGVSYKPPKLGLRYKTPGIPRRYKLPGWGPPKYPNPGPPKYKIPPINVRVRTPGFDFDKYSERRENDKKRRRFRFSNPFGEKSKRKSIISQPTRYVPSFSASVLKIRSKKKPKEFGGKDSYFFGFRPTLG